MALDPTQPRELLPCGRDPDTVADDVAAGTLDEHERSCPYCGEIIAGSAALGAAASELARDTDADPSPGLVPAVMQTVWSELRPGRRLALPSGAGSTFATETAVISALTAELDLIADLTVRRIRLAPAARAAAESDPGVVGESVSEPRGPVEEGGVAEPDPNGKLGAVDEPAAGVLPAVSLTASARYPADIGALAATARAAVVRCAQELFGLTPLRVDIDITDLQLPVSAR